MNDTVLTVKNLDKSFGKVKILADVNLTVGKGEICGLIGPNGAGKTTLLRLIGGLMKPTGGSIAIKTERPFIGYMPQSCRFDDHRSVATTIAFFAAVKKDDAKKSLAFCQKLKLDTTKKVKHLSPGQQKKLQIVIAMAGDPDFYILDEPTAGLDPGATLEIMAMIRTIRAEDKSILVSSHILGDLSEICTHVAMMENGRLTYREKLTDCFVVKTTPIPGSLLQTLKSKYRFKTNADDTVLTVSGDQDQVSALVSELSRYGVAIFEMSALNLKSVVRDLIEKSGEGA